MFVLSGRRGSRRVGCSVALLATGLSLACGLSGARAAPLALLDGRGWEMVSPVEKNGGEVQGFGGNAGGDVLQAAADGESATFSSASSFGGEALGAPVASQYVSRRDSGGWSTQDVTLPTSSGAFGEEPDGVPYRLFSGDLARAVVFDGAAYFLRESAGGGLTVLPGEAPQTVFEGAAPDLRHLVLALEGGLYEYSAGSSTLLSAVPGARLAPQAGAVSEDGSRVYFNAEGDLWLREGAQTKGVDEAVGGGGELLAATPDGALAFFAKAGALYRYDAVAGTASELDPGGAVEAPLDVTPDGARLVFLSKASLTGYDNTDQDTGLPDSEVFLWSPAAGATSPASPATRRTSAPIGPSTIPGAIANGAGPAATRSYKPRVLSAGGRRIFFDSRDALVSQDTNNDDDVYEWEAQGTGSCAQAGGCVELISSGRCGRRRLLRRRLRRRPRRLLPHRRLAGRRRSRRGRPLRRPRRRRLPDPDQTDRLRRRRLPAAALAARRPDPGHAGADPRQPAGPLPADAVREGQAPGRTPRQDPLRRQASPSPEAQVSRRLAIAALLACGALALLCPAAQASFGFLPSGEGFDVTIAGEGEVGVDTQAGSHPYEITTSVNFKQSGGVTDGDLRDLDLELPPGLIENPSAVSRCTLAAFHTPRTSPFEAEPLGGELPRRAPRSARSTMRTSRGGGATRRFGLFNLAAAAGRPGPARRPPFGVADRLRRRTCAEADGEYGLTLAAAQLPPAARRLRPRPGALGHPLGRSPTTASAATA